MSSDSERHSRLSLWTRNVALAVAAAVGSLLVSEFALRLLGISYPVFVWTDPVLGIAHIPGAKGGPVQSDGRPLIEINSDGWRGPEVPLEHPAGTYRIALLGDSFIQAFEVPFEKTAAEVLEHRLSALRGTPVEVLNFGEGGYGTGQELLVLQHYVWKYHPDLVVLAVTTGNDISDNYRRLKRTDYVPYFVYQGRTLVEDTTFLHSQGYLTRALWTRRLQKVVEYSRVAQLVNRVRHEGRKTDRQRLNAEGLAGDELGLRDEIHLPPATPDWQEAWKVTEGILQLIRDECRQHNTPLSVVTLTRGIQVTPLREKKEKFLSQLGAPDFYYAERRVTELGEREGFPVFNLAPPMAAQAEQRQVFFHAAGKKPGVGHWNVEGNRVAGELIASWLANGLAHDSTTKSHS